METSAKSNNNVEEAFFSLARDIKKRLIDTAQDQKLPSSNMNLNEPGVVKAAGSCCQ